MLKDDLEELENTKHIKKCEFCIFKDYASSGEWCHIFPLSPIKKCYEFELKRSIREAIEIAGLVKTYPHLLGDE